LNLYLLTRPDPAGYDEYQGAVVAARSADAASRIHPREGATGEWWAHPPYVEEWDEPEKIIIEYLGKANQKHPGLILAAFNAG
jgi:hypothetical protein